MLAWLHAFTGLANAVF